MTTYSPDVVVVLELCCAYSGNFPVLAGPQMDPAKSLKKVLKPEFLGK